MQRLKASADRFLARDHDFVAGWMTEETGRTVWGRPVGLLVLADGSLLISDDGGEKIWRVTYKVGKK